MGKDQFDAELPTESGLYLYQVANPKVVLGLRVTMQGNEPYSGGMPLMDCLGHPKTYLFMGPFTRRGYEKALDKLP